jgi:hypothetical protein
MTSKLMTYGGYIERLSRKVEARLSDIEAIFNFDFGDEFEVAMCQLLKNILPSKYGVCRGFVVAEDGELAGDDLLIYDKMTCPTLRASAGLEYSVKEQIPVDAVYAYIECKHSISDQSVFNKAMHQTREVKRVLLSRPSRRNSDYEKDGPTYNGKIMDWPRTYPEYKNQPYCAIFSKNSNGQVPQVIIHDEYTPDLLVLGKDHIATQSVVLGPDGIKGALFNDHKFWSGLRVEPAKGNAFGIGLLSLMQALNWIELMPIDWSRSLNGAFASIVFGEK